MSNDSATATDRLTASLAVRVADVMLDRGELLFRVKIKNDRRVDIALLPVTDGVFLCRKR